MKKNTYFVDFTVTSQLTTYIEAESETAAEKMALDNWVLLDHEDEATDIEFHSVTKVSSETRSAADVEGNTGD